MLHCALRTHAIFSKGALRANDWPHFRCQSFALLPIAIPESLHCLTHITCRKVPVLVCNACAHSQFHPLHVTNMRCTQPRHGSVTAYFVRCALTAFLVPVLFALLPRPKPALPDMLEKCLCWLCNACAHSQFHLLHVTICMTIMMHLTLTWLGDCLPCFARACNADLS